MMGKIEKLPRRCLVKTNAFTNTAPAIHYDIRAANPVIPRLMLLSRPALFLLFQGMAGLVLVLGGNPEGWKEAARWWPFAVILTNISSTGLLAGCMKIEGKKYFDLLRFLRETWKKDVVWLVGLSVVGLPVAAAPMNTLAAWIFGDSMTPVYMMFRPLPTWALMLSFLFPLTIAFSELPTYFGYCMPRLEKQARSSWKAWLLAGLALAGQHMFLPFIADGRFLLWRMGMYLPFALFTGLVLKVRPQLLPYFVVVHALMDFSTVAVYWMI
jgi:hypothetical protein